MVSRRHLFPLAIGLVSVLVLLADDASAQCSGGGGRRGPSPTGSNAVLASNLAYSSNPLVANYASPAGGLTGQYQRQVALLQNQINTMVYQNAQRQRLAKAAYDQRVMPMRLARAEAKRAARAERIAERLRQRDSDSISSASDSLSLTSVIAK